MACGRWDVCIRCSDHSSPLLMPCKKKGLSQWHGSFCNVLMSNLESRSVSSSKEAKEMKPCLFQTPAWVVDFSETQSKEEMLRLLTFELESSFSVDYGCPGSPFKNDLRNDI